MNTFTGKSDTELQKLLREKQSLLREERFAVAGSKQRDVKSGHNLRKDIARILTEIHKRNEN